MNAGRPITQQTPYPAPMPGATQGVYNPAAAMAAVAGQMGVAGGGGIGGAAGGQGSDLIQLITMLVASQQQQMELQKKLEAATNGRFGGLQRNDDRQGGGDRGWGWRGDDRGGDRRWNGGGDDNRRNNWGPRENGQRGNIRPNHAQKPQQFAKRNSPNRNGAAAEPKQQPQNNVHHDQVNTKYKRPVHERLQKRSVHERLQKRPGVEAPNGFGTGVVWNQSAEEGQRRNGNSHEREQNNGRNRAHAAQVYTVVCVL